MEAADVLRAKAWADGQRNAAWTEAHQRDLAAYAGHWVCIADARVAVADRNRKRFAARV